MFKYFFERTSTTTEPVSVSTSTGPDTPRDTQSTLTITYLVGDGARDITYTIKIPNPDDRPVVDETTEGYRHWMTKHTLMWYDFFSWFFDTNEQVFVMNFRNGSAIYDRQYISTFSVYEETK